MSSSSVPKELTPTSPGQEWDDLVHPFSNGNQNRTWQDILGGGGGPRADYFGLAMPHSDPVDSKAPGAPPARANANQVALNDQLTQEGQTRQYAPAGPGLLDDQPKTASRVLLGS